MAVVGEQFSIGDQDLASRQAFYANGKRSCIKCQKDVTQTEHTAGCRMDGDAYGTTVFECSDADCGWSTSFQWDESADSYYYECQYWGS